MTHDEQEQLRVKALESLSVLADWAEYAVKVQPRGKTVPVIDDLKEAIRLILIQPTPITLTLEQHEAFIAALDNPPESAPALKRLLRDD